MSNNDCWQLVGIIAYAAVVFNIICLGFGLAGDWFRVMMFATMLVVLAGYRAAWLSGREERVARR